MIGILFLCWISTQETLSQTLSWTVATSVPKFKHDLKLTCTPSSSCCSSSSRIWTKNGTEILNDGKSSDPNKYVEEWDGGTTGFSLIIKSLLVKDVVNVDYDCQYSLYNDTHTLPLNGSWEYAPDIPEQCPFVWKPFSTKGIISIERTAPLPIVVAYFGDGNMTSDLILSQLTNFETWFYSLTVSIDIGVTCQDGEKFTLIVYTGTEETKICDHDNICKPNCFRCGGKAFAWGSLGMIFGLIFVFFGYVLGFSCCQPWCYARKLICCKFKKPGDYSYTFYGKEYTKEEVNIRTTLSRAVVVTVICYLVYYAFVSLFIIGIFCSICANDNELYSMLFGFGSLTFMCTFHWTIKHFNDEYSLRQWLTLIGLVLLINLIIPIPFLIVYYRLHDDDSSLKRCLRYIGLVLLATLIFPIPFLIIYYYLKDNKGDDQSGGKSQSVESGSSCWPICRVGQDPNSSSSDPEKVRRSPEKERADKKKERKPTEVVRPQPHRALPPMTQHLGTENTRRAEFSTETEMYKPRPLPSISGQSDSRRPLPKRTPDDLEKSSVQLKPLGDSISEKKKKKKRKKKETKLSDEDD